MANGVSKMYPTRDWSGASATDLPFSATLSEVGGALGEVIEDHFGNLWMLVQAGAAISPCRFLQVVSIEKEPETQYGIRTSFEVQHAENNDLQIVGVSPNWLASSTATITENFYFYMCIAGIVTVECDGGVSALESVSSAANGIADSILVTEVVAGQALEADDSDPAGTPDYPYTLNGVAVAKVLLASRGMFGSTT